MPWDLPEAPASQYVEPFKVTDAGNSSIDRPRVLIVDLDESLNGVLTRYLKKYGFEVDSALDGRAMDQALENSKFDAVVVEITIPGEGGLSICRRLSDSGRAVVLLSSASEDMDRVVGLELGAEDYLSKPFHPRELVARLRAVLRGRTYPRNGSRARYARYQFGGYELDATSYRLIRPSGESAPLGRTEFMLLFTLLNNSPRVLSRDCLAHVSRKQTAEPSARVVDVQISRLRRKLGCGDCGEIIRTVPGLGYRLAVPVRCS